MRRQRFYILVILAFCVMLAGCSKKKEEKVNLLEAGNVKENTLLVKNDGTVQSSLVEEFDKSYYVKSELEEYINNELEKYNGKNGGQSVTMHSLDVKDGIASVVFDYTGMDVYAAFNNVRAISGTVSEVENELPDTMESVSDKSNVEKAKILKNNKYKVVIVEEELDVMVDGKVQYISNGTLINENTVKTIGGEPAVIVYL